MLELESLTTPKPFNRPPNPFPTYNPPLGLRSTTLRKLTRREPKLYILFLQEVNTLNLTFLTYRNFFPMTIFSSNWYFWVIVWLAKVSYS
jgi:hypothetical protein